LHDAEEVGDDIDRKVDPEHLEVHGDDAEHGSPRATRKPLREPLVEPPPGEREDDDPDRRGVEAEVGDLPRRVVRLEPSRRGEPPPAAPLGRVVDVRRHVFADEPHAA
jgi:hypothetical protein